MQRIPDKKQSRQYHLSHDEVEILEKHRQRRRKAARRGTGTKTADEPRGLLNTLLAILIVVAIVYVVAQIAGGI